MALKIQVLGKGMIPRGYGLAPRKEPFMADRTLIATILATPGLKVKYLNPNTNKFEGLTRDNFNRIYQAYNGVTAPTKKVAVTAPQAPLTPTPAAPVTPKAADVVSTAPVVEEKKEETPVEDVAPVVIEEETPAVEEKVEEDVVVPVAEEEEKSNNNNYNKNNNYKNNKKH